MKTFHRALSWYFSKKAMPYWCILLVDCLIVLFSDYLIYALDFGVGMATRNFTSLAGAFSFYLIFYIVSFRLFHTYSGVIRYSSFVDLKKVGLAMACGLFMSILWQTFVAIGDWAVLFPIKNMVLATILAILIAWGVRVLIKSLYDETIAGNHTKNVFIYGVREGGVSLAKSIRGREDSPFEIKGFVSDRNDMIGKMLMGVKVYPNDSSLVERMKKEQVGILIVSPLKSDDLRHNNGMVNSLIDAGIRIFMIPSAQEWDGKSNLSYTQLKEVNVEDLLPRDKIEVDMEAIGRLLRGRRIMITGRPAVSVRKWSVR